MMQFLNAFNTLSGFVLEVKNSALLNDYEAIIAYW